MRHSIHLALFLLSLAFAACSGGGGTVDITQYDASCTADADCGIVRTGDVCSCGCAYGAIRASEVTKFNQAASALADSCSNEDLCMPCETDSKAVCQQGTCAVAK